jgi:DNA-binding GntR family transcriptional regulator
MKITPRPMAEEVAKQLRYMIENGDVSPGSQLREKAICDQFGVSRTPVREAFRMLSSEGVVELTPNRSVRVVRLSSSMLVDVFKVMAALESLSGELACERMSDADIEAVRALHDRMAGHFAAKERIKYLDLNRRIHEALVNGSQNEPLIDSYFRLDFRVQRARFATQIGHREWVEAMRDHKLMIDALEQRDGVALARVLRDHLINKLTMFMQSGFVVEEQLLENAQ